MKVKIFAIGAAALLVLMLINAPVSNAQQDVEPGIDGLLDIQTNLDNIIGLIRYVIYSLTDWITDIINSLTDWIKGIMGYIEAFPDIAGLTAGFYLSVVSILLWLPYTVIMFLIFLPLAILSIIPLPAWLLYIPTMILIVLALATYIVGGLAGIIGGYFVLSNSDENRISRIAGIIQIFGGLLQMTVIGAVCGLPIQFVSVILQFLGISGVV